MQLKIKLIKNGKIVTPEKIIHGDILIKEGKIQKIITEKRKFERFDEEIYDAEGNYILPGLIEVHGHMREPGMEQKEDVPHGTQAAIAGGVTTVIDMPNTKPPTVTVKLLKEKINKIYPGRSYTDYAFFLGVAKDELEELEKVNPRDIAGVKVFMAGHETTPTTIPDDETLGKIFRVLAKRNILIAVHAEDQWLVNYYTGKLKNMGRKDPASWSEARPKEVVVTAAARAISLAEQYAATLYLLHLSTPEEFILVEAAQKRGLKVYSELVGYQLLFNIKDYKRLGNKIKVSPAVRSGRDQQEVWEFVKSGRVDTICSEHTPHEVETKNQPDVWIAQSGTPGIQETLPAIITAWKNRYGRENLGEGLKTIVKHCSNKIADIFGFSSKGSIEKGKDADLVIVDVNNYWSVKKKDLLSKCGWSAYEGMKLIGRPIATFLRGELIYNDGRIVGKPQGQWLHKHPLSKNGK